MSIDRAAHLIRYGQHDEALALLATLPDSPEVHYTRWLAASPANRPEARKAAVVLATQQLAPEQFAALFNWAVDREHAQLVVDLGRPYLGHRVDDQQFMVRVGQSAKDVRQHHLAFFCLHQALVLSETDAQHAAVHALLAAVYKDYGQIDLALRHFQQAYKHGRETMHLHNLLMGVQYAQADLQSYYTQARELRRFSNVQRVVHHVDRLDPGRAAAGLRIGLIGGDFTSHSLTPLLLEIIDAIPQISKHQIYIYHNRPETAADASTAAYKNLATGWLNVHDVPADDVVLSMLQDQLDVLIDLAGHTAFSRLDVLAHRPAPVQIGWVSGMMTPSGLETCPYFLADEGMLTPAIRAACPEQLVALPSAYVYTPVHSVPLDTRLPVDRRPAIQFGCMNNPCKLTQPVLDAWARVLTALPASVLHLKSGGLDGAAMLGREFARRGLDARRVVCVQPMPSHMDVQRYYAENIDIALDPWPCAGMLTTLEAWWCGVPTITLVGDTFLHNQSASVLKQLGQHDLICQSVDQYVEQAVRLAGDKQRLRAIRADCRTMLDATLIRKPRDVAQHVINGIEGCWRDWCASRRALVDRLA